MGQIGNNPRRVEVVPETKPVRRAPTPTPAPAPQKVPAREPIPV